MENWRNLEVMKKLLEKHREEWLSRYNALDITIGLKERKGELTDEVCFKFWVADKIAVEKLSTDNIIPLAVGGVHTDVKKEEPFEALSYLGEGRLRPIKMGSSIGNITITAGTAGFLYKRSGQHYILTNAHVAAEDPFKYVKDQIVRNVQPGAYHQGKDPEDYCGKMRYMFLLFNRNKSNPTVAVGLNEDGTFVQSGYINTVDAALIKLEVEGVKDIIDLPNAPRIKEAVPELGDEVVMSSWKMGGVSEGVVTDLGKSSLVTYGDGKTALLRDLIVVSKMGEPGTSGSGVLRKKDKAAIGLNFAGNSTNNLICSIQHINAGFSGEVVVFEGEEPPTPPEPPEPPEKKRYKVDLKLKIFNAEFPITGTIEEENDTT